MSQSTLPTVKGNKFIINKAVYVNYTTPVEFKDIEYPLPSIPVAKNDQGEPILVKEDEILIKVKAASLNPVDIALHSFSFKRFPGTSAYKPFGIDLSGDIVQIGSKATTKYLQYNSQDSTKSLKVGDKVYASMHTGSLLGSGAIAEFILIKSSTPTALSKIPEGMSYEEAATLGVVSGTAFTGLKKYKGESLKGKNILILGGGTSVGYSAAQFAKYHFQAKNIVVTCSSSSSPDIESIGAQSLDYTKGTTYVKEQLLEFVAKNGKFDFIYDTIRGSDIYPYIYDILKTKKEFGAYRLVAGSKTMSYTGKGILDVVPDMAFIKMALKTVFCLSSYEVLLANLYGDTELASVIDELYRKGEFKIRINKVLPPSQLQDAYDLVASGKSKGKVVIKIE